MLTAFNWRLHLTSSSVRKTPFPINVSIGRLIWAASIFWDLFCAAFDLFPHTWGCRHGNIAKATTSLATCYICCSCMRTETRRRRNILRWDSYHYVRIITITGWVLQLLILLTWRNSTFGRSRVFMHVDYQHNVLYGNRMLRMNCSLSQNFTDRSSNMSGVRFSVLNVFFVCNSLFYLLLCLQFGFLYTRYFVYHCWWWKIPLNQSNPYFSHTTLLASSVQTSDSKNAPVVRSLKKLPCCRQVNRTVWYNLVQL